MFHLLDPEKWERQKHFEYYMQMIPCGYTVTVRLDVENLYQQVKKCGLKFYPAFIYCAGKVVNEKKEFKMGVDQEGRPGYFDVMHPNFTIFHKDDHTFSDIWSYYDDDFQTCYQNIINDMETYKDVKGPKGKEEQPPNFFCISCVPWMDFTGYSTWVPTGRPNLFPIITFGKYVEEEGRRKLSAALTISHASADGYHASMFFERLQEVLNEFVIENKIMAAQYGREDRKDNDLFFTCGLIDYIACKTKNKRCDVVNKLGKECLERIYDLADIYHSDNIDRVSDDFIEEAEIKTGTFDNVGQCQYAIPSHWDIGKTYKRVIKQVAEYEQISVVDALIKVYNSFLSEKIDDYNSSMYYENPFYLFECYKENKVI